MIKSIASEHCALGVYVIIGNMHPHFLNSITWVKCLYRKRYTCLLCLTYMKH